MAKVLVIRLSAIGDVAMTIPVIYSAANENPGDTFTVLTQTFLIPLFINRPENVDVIGINTKGSERNLRGIIRFAYAFSEYDYDIILDLHNVLRTFFIRSFFKIRAKKVFVLDKARKARKELTRKEHKKLHPLRPMFERYADVFRSSGIQCHTSFTSLFESRPANIEDISDFVGEKNKKWIGVAPFAKHINKIYPLENMERVVAALAENGEYEIFLFGGKGQEEDLLFKWSQLYPNVKSVAGRYSLDNELALISKLNLFLSMDSANMHFASLVGTRVLSVWGATHPYTGFYGFHQELSDAVQLDLYCRPCSIYGNKPCYRGDRACLTLLSPEMIIERISKVFKDENCN